MLAYFAFHFFLFSLFFVWVKESLGIVSENSSKINFFVIIFGNDFRIIL